MDDHQNVFASKLNDLTYSLNRTTDVLSTTDRMIDHYKDRNREQENEIARLQNDVWRYGRTIRSQQYENDLLKASNGERGYYDHHPKRNGDQDSSKALRTQESSSESELQHGGRRSKAERKRKRNRSNGGRKSRNTSRVHFADDSISEDDLDMSVSDIQRRQRLLEREIEKERVLRDREISQLDVTFRKSMLATQTEKKSEYDEMTQGKLQQLQSKIEEEHEIWKQQQNDIKAMANEMRSLKDSVKEALTPKRKYQRKGTRAIELEDATDDDSELQLTSYKKRIRQGENKINTLREELKKKEMEQKKFESAIEEIKSVGNFKSSQLDLLGKQVELEKSEKSKLLREFQEMQEKANNLEKERSELVLLLNEARTEARSRQKALEKSSQTIPELKLLLEKSERQRDKFFDHTVKMESEIERKEATINSKEILINDLTQQLQKLRAKLTEMEAERSDLDTHITDLRERCKKKEAEKDALKNLLLKSEDQLKIFEKSKSELKRKALSTIREYKSKCTHYQKQITELHKATDTEQSKQLSKCKELEIANLHLQKDQQKLVIEMQNLKNDVFDRENQWSSEKARMADALIKSEDQNQETAHLQRNVDKLQSEVANLSSQLSIERRKCKEFENQGRENYKIYEELKDENSSLLRQMNEMKQETNKENLTTKNDIIIELRTKLKSSIEESRRIKRRYNAMKTELENKIRVLEMNISKLYEVDEQSRKAPMTEVQSKQHEQQQQQQDIFTGHKENDNDHLRKVTAFILCYLENLHRLLSYEEENQNPVKEIPDNLPSEAKDQLFEFREKFQACYSITRTLKARFYHQKALIKKAQEKIRSQIQEKGNLKERYNNEILKHKEGNESLRDEMQRNDAQMKDAQKKLMEQSKVIESLQVKLSCLTKHLEECTRALQKSIEVGKDRQRVLNDIEKLQKDQEENQKINENFYRYSEKNEILSELLNDAKSALHQLKQDSFDSNNFTSSMIETFDSVSPNKKRKLFSFPSPPFRSTTKIAENYMPSYLDENSNGVSRSNTLPREPMSMDDDEFNSVFLSTFGDTRNKVQKSLTFQDEM